MSNLDRFEDVFEGMTNTVVLQADRIARVEKKVVAETEEEGVTRSLDLLAEIMDHVWERVSPLESLLEQVVDNLYGLLGINQEMVSDEARRRELEKVKRGEDNSADFDFENPKPKKEDTEGFLDGLFGSLKNISFRQFLTAAMIAPFAYKFAEGFISEITDEMVELTPAGVTGLSAMVQGKAFPLIQKMIKPFTRAIDSITKASGFFANVGDRIKDGFDAIKKTFTKLRGTIRLIRSAASSVSGPIVKFGGMLKSVGGFITKTFSMMPGAGAMKLLLGRLAWPITILFGIVEGVRDFMKTEGSLLEKFEAGLAGYFGEIVGAPLNLLGDIVGWVLKKFGFENAGQRLADFDFKEKIDDIISGMFDVFLVIGDALASIGKWVRKLFSNPVDALKDLWSAALGGYKSLMDIIWYPIDKAVQWISGIFGWEEGKDFSLTDFVWGTVSSAWNWVKGLFTNPLDTLKDYWNTYVGAWQDIGEFIWDGIKGAWDWISGKFGNFTSNLQADWNDLLAAAGVESLMGLLWKPVSSAWDWITEKFGWSSDDAPEIDIVGTMKEWIDDLKAWIGSIFPNLPSTAEISKAFYDSLPSWMQKVITKVSGSPDNVPDTEEGVKAELDRLLTERSRLRDQYDNLSSSAQTSSRGPGSSLRAQISEMDSNIDYYESLIRNSFAKGTKGFMDFGKQTPVMLHNREAVVPEATPAGKFLAEYFDDDWKPKINTIAAAAATTPVVTNNNMAITKQRYVSESAQQSSIEQARAQRAITNIAPSIMSSRPTTNNNTSTTIINNNSPSRSLDDPSMLK